MTFVDEFRRLPPAAEDLPWYSYLLGYIMDGMVGDLFSRGWFPQVSSFLEQTQHKVSSTTLPEQS